MPTAMLFIEILFVFAQIIYWLCRRNYKSGMRTVIRYRLFYVTKE